MFLRFSAVSLPPTFRLFEKLRKKEQRFLQQDKAKLGKRNFQLPINQQFLKQAV
jgi:hypothetical protein